MAGKYSSDDSEMSTEDLLKSFQENPLTDKPKKKPETIKEHTKKAESGGILGGYFSKRKKIMEELDK